MIYSSLYSLHPLAPWAVLVAALWGTAYVIRARFPALWLPLTLWPNPAHPVAHVVQGLPTVFAGAVFAGLAQGNVESAVAGAVCGALAPIWHHLLKAAPSEYRGQLGRVTSSLRPKQ
jgi:hypothetical protein